jgi:O-succinylhomoserine sulfhydrylase
VFLETPSNPGLEIIDLAAVCELAHTVGALVIVDNIFASPVLQKPLEFGADVVVYSATKHIDGQGRTLGGAVLGTKEFVSSTLMPFLRHTGPSLSPFNAWVLLKGMETLSLRVNAMCTTADSLARWLSAHPSVASMRYPGHASHPQFELASTQMKRGGTVLTLTVRGREDQAKQNAFDVMNRLGLWDISNNIGDAKSLVTHPATTTHRRLSAEARKAVGITDGMIRLSVGLEDVEDLADDLGRALDSLH